MAHTVRQPSDLQSKRMYVPRSFGSCVVICGDSGPWLSELSELSETIKLRYRTIIGAYTCSVAIAIVY